MTSEASAGAHLSEWAIEVQGLTKSFGNYRALRGMDLKVKRGESVVVFGPNGAGKTTLIRVLATITSPSEGRVLVDGLDLKDNAEEVRRRLGVVTHQTFLYGNLTGHENLEFYGRMFDVAGLKERIREVADMVGMTSRLHDRVGVLSRGMQQRLSIARCLLHRPQIVLLDEPETGLDQQAMSMLWKALGEGEQKRAIILTTHNLERGYAVCDRMLILARGRIAYECPRQALDAAGLKQAYYDCTGIQA